LDRRVSAVMPPVTARCPLLAGAVGNRDVPKFTLVMLWHHFLPPPIHHTELFVNHDDAVLPLYPPPRLSPHTHTHTHTHKHTHTHTHTRSELAVFIKNGTHTHTHTHTHTQTHIHTQTHTRVRCDMI